MASLHRRSNGPYLLSLRYGPHQIQRSLRTRDEGEAQSLQSLIELRLRHLRQGVLVLPDSATPDDLWAVLRHGQLPTANPKPLVKKVSLGVLADRYLQSHVPGSKDDGSIDTERTHLNNLTRLLGGSTPLIDIQPASVRSYIEARLGENGNRGGKIQPDTVRKELQTFSQMWDFANAEGCVAGDCPLARVKLPKKRRRPPFQTWEQIEARIKRGGLTEFQVAELWDCLYLRQVEVLDFLQHVREASRDYARFPFIHPALAFCAFTGVRRSEMFRCQIDDVADGLVNIREKKKDKDYEFSHRPVPIIPELSGVLEEWLSHHPGGQFLFCKNGKQPLEDRTSREGFKAVTKDSKWSVLRGYHVLRHSFASNLAMQGIEDRVIRRLMGHQSEEMTLRYQHLFPEKQVDAIHVLSSCKRPRIFPRSQRSA